MKTQQTAEEAFAALGAAAPRTGLRDHVYERVLTVLLSGELTPGSRLGIETIARQLGVSPTPVREAFVELERTGLVIREALKGYRMAPPLTKAQIAELLDARIMLETTAARLATPATPVLLKGLRNAHRSHAEVTDRILSLQRSNSAPDIAEAGEFYAMDKAFHRVIFENCGNRYIAGMSDVFGAQLHRMRQALPSGVSDAEEALAEHAEILRAFEGGAGAMSPEDAMRTHVENARSRAMAVEDDSAG